LNKFNSKSGFTREAQLAAFPVLILALVIPRHELLIEELLALERTNSRKFQGKHDDTVFALLWATFEALRADITII